MKKHLWDVVIGVVTLAILAVYGSVIWSVAHNEPLRLGVLALIGLAFAYFVWRGRTRYRRRKQKVLKQEFPAEWRRILQERVRFYQELPASGKKDFEHKVQWFLHETEVTGIGTEVDDMVRVLVAASAVIPIFFFEDWYYRNVDEVLIYPRAFDGHTYAQEGKGRDTLGMVGTGAMGRKVILSKPALINGFLSTGDGHNTGVHEFVHLLDASDGEFDGVPALMDKKYVMPWLGMMYQEMKKIEHGESILRDYGATNKVEFFAVASELFLEHPDKLKKEHRDLYDMLANIFHAKD